MGFFVSLFLSLSPSVLLSLSLSRSLYLYLSFSLSRLFSIVLSFCSSPLPPFILFSPILLSSSSHKIFSVFLVDLFFSPFSLSLDYLIFNCVMLKKCLVSFLRRLLSHRLSPLLYMSILLKKNAPKRRCKHAVQL